MRFMTMPPLQYRENILLRITSNVDNYNMFTEAGSPDRIVKVILVLEAGLIIGSTDTAVASLQTGSGWKAGSKLVFVSKASVIGAGGAGGISQGLTNNYGCIYGLDGLAGGNALDIQYPLFIDNTAGNIYGGGGGGGGGGSFTTITAGLEATGGGGGGGAGANGGAGGVADIAGTWQGQNGVSGGANGGAGGRGGVIDGSAEAGTGGKGGDYGEAGVGGVGAAVGTYPCSNGPESVLPLTVVNNGGAAGKAINLNGNTVTWLGGNNSSQVKGAVS